MRTPPRLPLPWRPHLTYGTPPLPGIKSPASGLRAMKSTNSNLSSWVQTALAWRMNTAVSATAIGRVRIGGMYASGVYFQAGHRGSASLGRPPGDPAQHQWRTFYLPFRLYDMYALRESERQMRGIAPAKSPAP